MTLLTTTASSWGVIIRFLKEYQKKGNLDQTVAWARIIDDAYFTKMGAQDHPMLAALLKRSLENAQGDEGGLDSSVWAMKHHMLIDYVSDASERLLKLMNRQDLHVQAGTQEAREIAKALNEAASKNTATRTDTNIHQSSRFVDP